MTDSYLVPFHSFFVAAYCGQSCCPPQERLQCWQSTLCPHVGGQPQPGRADEVDGECLGGLHGGVVQPGDSGSARDCLAVVVRLRQQGDGAAGHASVVAALQSGLQHVYQTVPQSPGDAGSRSRVAAYCSQSCCPPQERLQCWQSTLCPHVGAQPQPGRADEVDVEGAGGLNGGVRQSGDSGSAGDRLPVVVGLCQEGDGAGGQVVVVAGLQPGL